MSDLTTRALIDIRDQVSQIREEVSEARLESKRRRPA
jgi:hypothetical protein